jgi:hypothetical protein
MMVRIWKLPREEREAFDLSSLVRVVSSSAFLPEWLRREWIEWIGPDRVWEAYGGSERIVGTLISGREWLERPGSVGRVSEGRKIKIVGPEGETLPAGEIGDVYGMPPGGPGSTYHYLGAEPRRLADGWETLGDMGYLDEEGFLYLVDRRTDLVITGGANVYPAEVEGGDRVASGGDRLRGDRAPGRRPRRRRACHRPGLEAGLGGRAPPPRRGAARALQGAAQLRIRLGYAEGRRGQGPPGGAPGRTHRRPREGEIRLTARRTG